ncbi:4Fe-4S binding protein [Aliarcobacter skirrowii]|uniref:4Fe-4S binding protein n=1 Tax=Aliarcobacter skirrowii TaxID=28200 RepID=UPI0029AE4F31|nr:4Fe-4S binding protein [Aliarcobacter skirrowii]MDX3959842.1 4Fe-4S binding protein [Aliarcobacter skirrowii]
MIKFIKRDKNDIFGMPILKIIFKNKIFHRTVQVSVLFLFIYAIYFGFIHPTKENNIFTTALFWGLFWPFFMVTTLATFGRIFCGVCPHGFIGKYITKIGLKKKIPNKLANPFIGLLLLFFAWWFVYYMFPQFFKTSYATAILFFVMTIIASIFYYLYDEMAYCKYICPIGTVTKVYSKVGFTKLQTYKQECQNCRTFDCAKVCSYNLKPFTFEKKNSMEDCTLCMDCARECESVAFKFNKPSNTLFNKFKTSKAEVWALILLTAAISITMSFHHSLGRSAIVEEFFWVKTARYFETIIDFGSIDTVGLFAFIYAVIISIFLSIVGIFIASKIMRVEFSNTFYTLGYAFAPLFIIGGLSHIGEFFFYSYASNIVNGFNQAFSLGFETMKPLASRKDEWVHIFNIFTHIGYIWAFIIMINRLKLIETKRYLKIVAFPFASALIIFYMSLNFYKVYIFDTYGKINSHNHMNHKK